MKAGNTRKRRRGIHVRIQTNGQPDTARSSFQSRGERLKNKI